VKIAYVHPRDYPSQETNALQAIRMASAFQEIADTTFFIPRLTIKKEALKRNYGISDSSLYIRPMHFNYVPDRILINLDYYFEKTVSFYLRKRPQWKGYEGRKVLFVRDSKELLFWGFQKGQFNKFHDWTFVFEAHSTIGLHPNPEAPPPVFVPTSDKEKQYHQSVRQALLGFDIVLCVTQAMVDALSTWTDHAVKPVLVRHASPLQRLASQPEIQFGEKIIIGYIGQISQFKGVELLLEALRFLPQNCILRLVGKQHPKKDVDPVWFQNYLRDPQLTDRIEVKDPVLINEITEVIDGCDIVVQPASRDILNSKFEAPLKSFDYMARGKPIVVADVPCHHELYEDSVNGLFYSLNPQQLASCILRLINNPMLAQKVAQGAWDQASRYEYSKRTKTILSLLS